MNKTDQISTNLQIIGMWELYFIVITCNNYGYSLKLDMLLAVKVWGRLTSMFCIFFIPLGKVECVFFLSLCFWMSFWEILWEYNFGVTMLYPNNGAHICMHTNPICLCPIEFVLKELSPFVDSGPVVNKSNATSSSLKPVIYSRTNCFVIKQTYRVDLCFHSRNTFETWFWFTLNNQVDVKGGREIAMKSIRGHQFGLQKKSALQKDDLVFFGK